MTTKVKRKRGVSFPVYSIIYEFELTIGNLLIDTKLNLYCIVENFRLFRVFCSVGFKWTYICLNEQKLLLRYTLFCIHIWWWIKHIADIVDHFFLAHFHFLIDTGHDHQALSIQKFRKYWIQEMLTKARDVTTDHLFIRISKLAVMCYIFSLSQ